MGKNDLICSNKGTNFVFKWVKLSQDDLIWPTESMNA